MAGFVVLHLLCCGVPLLVASGALSGAGALTGSPALVMVGAVVLLAAGVLAVRRLRTDRRAGADACCAPDQQSGAHPTATDAITTARGNR